MYHLSFTLPVRILESFSYGLVVTGEGQRKHIQINIERGRQKGGGERRGIERGRERGGGRESERERERKGESERREREIDR